MDAVLEYMLKLINTNPLSNSHEMGWSRMSPSPEIVPIRLLMDDIKQRLRTEPARAG